MSAGEFEAALNAPDSDASHAQFYKLISDRRVRGDALSTVAEKYLDAFCDATLSVLRRRWIGLATLKMMSSPHVREHLKSLPSHLPRVGDVILGANEQEEIKIVAGLLLRQGLVHGIDFARFWPSDKVPSSAPVFPRNPGPMWMSDFQNYLDALCRLALTKPLTDPGIMYPVSFIASDGYKWTDQDGAMAIAIIQEQNLTLITTDSSLKTIGFIDTSLTHVESVASRKATLYDSQARTTKHEPWDVILRFEPDSVYSVNTTQHRTTELTLLFATATDAKEWQQCVQEVLNALPDRPKSSTARLPGSASGFIEVGLSLPQESGDESQRVQHMQQSLDEDRQLVENSTSPDPIHGHNTSQANTKYKITVSQSGTNSRKSIQNKHTNDSSPQKTTQTDNRSKNPNGGLPEIKKPPRKTAGAAPELRAMASDIYEFPDDSPREKCTSGSVKSRALKKKAPVVTNIAESNSIRPTRQRSNITKQVNGNEGGQNASSPQLSSPTQFVAARKSVGLPKESNTHTVTGLKAKKDMSQTHKIGKASQQPRAKRKAAIDTDYENTDPTENSESEFDEGDARLKVTDTKTSSSARPVKALRKSKTGINNAKSSKSQSRSISPEKHVVLATLHSILQPPPSAFPKRNASHGNEKIEETIYGVVRGSDPPSPSRSEANTLNRHNQEEGNGLDSFITASTGTCDKSTTKRKRTHKTSPPSTPRKRAKVENRFIHGRPVTGSSDRQPSTMAPPKVLRDPSSPSRQLKHAPKSQIVTSQQMENRRTPVHITQDYYSGGSANLQILSSNSKPLPASPTAESRAISGHVEQSRLETEIGACPAQTNNPFNLPKVQKLNAFTRRLTNDAPEHADDPLESSAQRKDVAYNDMNQPVHPSARQRQREVAPFDQAIIANKQRKAEDGICGDSQQPGEKTQPTVVDDYEDDLPMNMGLEGDTLWADEGTEALVPQASPAQFHSSPSPVVYASSSHSSTSAERDADEVVTPTSEDEEREWEAHLQPHQRSLRDQLLRVSKRLVRHIVDNETAVTDIADTYANDGVQLVNKLRDRHHLEFTESMRNIEKEKVMIRNELQQTVKNLKKQRAKYDAPPIENDRPRIQKKGNPAATKR